MKNIKIVTYHYIRPIKGSKFPRIKGLEFYDFKKQLDYLQSNHTILDYSSFIKILKTKKIQNNKKYCILTFDDGYKDHIKYVLPELKKRNLKGFFFPPSIIFSKKDLLDVNKVHFLLEKNINPDKIKKKIFQIIKNNKLFNKKRYSEKYISKIEKKYVNKDRFDNKKISFLKFLFQTHFTEKQSNILIGQLFKIFLNIDQKKFFSELYMNKIDLKKMIKSGMYIGGHGYNHVRFKNLTKNKLDKEIKLTFKFLKSIKAPTKDWIMCYPFGSYNNNSIKILKKKDSICAFTTNTGLVDIKKDNYFKLNRLDTNDIKI